MENKLIPMTDYVLSQKETKISEQDLSFSDRELKKLNRIYTCAEFLSRSLTLGMFVPVNSSGDILSEPADYEHYISDNEQYFNGDEWECLNYSDAMQKVLFVRCTVLKVRDHYVVYHNSKSIWISWTNRVIEDLIKHDIELTETAKKLLGYER